MKLLKIEMENFRQFLGKHTIEFSTGKNNITIIQGQNGMGKTGIFRALMFGLYGEKYLPQDNQKDKIHLVNLNTLEQGEPVTSRVKVYIENNQETLIFVRSIQAIKYNNEITERMGEVYLDYISDSGDYHDRYETDEIKIEEIANRILDKKIKDFFFFDGEKIETLAKTDRKVKEEVKSGIIQLMQIDKLEKAINITSSLLRKESDKIRQASANIDLDNCNKEIVNIENKIKDKEEILELKEENLSAVINEIKEIKERLEQNKTIREISEKADSISREIENRSNTLNAYKIMLNKGSFPNGHKLIMKDFYRITKNKLKDKLIEQDELVPIEVLDTSLDTGFCVCCNTNLKNDINAREFIENAKSNHRRSELSHLMSNMISRMEDFEDKKEKIGEDLLETLKKINKEKKNIEKLNVDLDLLKDQIREHGREQDNLRYLESTLSEKESLQRNLNIEIGIYTQEIKNLEKKLDDLERKYNKLLKANSKNEYEAKRLEIIQNLNSGLKKIFEDYSLETREVLSKETSDIFKQLIDEKDLNLINQIKINEKYEIEVYEKNNIRITQDISQGQRQIVALSFVTSLAKTANKGTEEIEFPLFMDTPFGRISRQNRENLIKNIPDLTKQWILLLTDTELTDFERSIFESEGKVGKMYKIKQIKPGHSIIEEVRL